MDIKMQKDLVCVAQFMSPHGIKGAIKIKSFTQHPESLEKYSPLYDRDDKQQYNIKILSSNNDVLTVCIDDINNRNDADILKNRFIYADKSLFDELEEEEFYQSDLINMDVFEDNNVIGKVVAIYNHGGGDIIEIELNNGKGKILYSFTKEIFPIVNVMKSFIVINQPKTEEI